MWKRKLLMFIAILAVIGTVPGWLSQYQAGAQDEPGGLLESPAGEQMELSPLTQRTANSIAHIFPTVSMAADLGILAPAVDRGPALYHGGPIMSNVTIYAIFWLPSSSKLQNRASTTIPVHYRTVLENMLADYPGHGIDNNNTQYYQTVGGTTTYIGNSGGFGGSYLDTRAYPASICTDIATPGNCITDAEIQSEIRRVMSLKRWTGGLNKIFLLFTSSGEGSCFDSTSTYCAYVQFCAYHSYFLKDSTPVIYANMPYGNPSLCQVSGTPSPNSDPPADTAATAACHEVTESITDPEQNAWYTADGNEIADLCAYNYGTNTWDFIEANQMWNGHFYELQQIFDNHVSACVQVGP
ncbi:MAG: hypothetical protein WAN11_15770 [Syntrophobacteraceae bacterium]